MTGTCPHPDTRTVFRLGVPIARRCTTCGATIPLTDEAPTQEVTGL